MDIQGIMATDIDFKFAYRTAVDYYLCGAWESALPYFKQCLAIRPRDGPTIEVYRYMEEYGFKAPPEWKGYRDLTEKLSKIID